ncbi:MAG: DUF1080 domain-containing protein [Mariniblastus sp.]
MKKSRPIQSFVLLSKSLTMLAVAIVFVGNVSAQEPPKGFEAIFNGKDLSGWYAMQTDSPRNFNALAPDIQKQKIESAREATSKFWRVENGEIVNDGKGPYLTTDKHYRDFELMIEYKTVAGADSGIYLKSTPQVQIWDSTDESKFGIGADKGSGGLWNNGKGSPGKDPLVKADKPFGEWNKFRILQVGSRTSIWLNDQMVVDHAVMENRHWGRESKLPLIVSGPIQLQTHGGEIRWKNIYMREIGNEEANEILNSKADGFESVFNGKDLSGWKGPVNGYEIVDGSLRCKPKSGGTIYTEKEYGDFVARMEFKLPPGGNNGLAIRYPGKGDTAYVGMCELQVLDGEHKRFQRKPTDDNPSTDALDARQHHGSAYGMVAAHRGYMRPTGEWNFQEVTVKGSTIKVELNGTVILDCDLSTVTEFLADKPHPGKDRKTGHFGLAGHNDPVEYRNLSIKTIDN